jgi:SecD/SecF fusion protein
MTIFDSNLTTLMTAVVLFQFGTGPIKGYAVTLTMGLAISMFTAVFVTRIVFDYLTGGGAKAVMQDTIPVGRFRIFPHANYDFIRYAVPAVLGSVTILVAGGLSIFLHSGVNKGIDFAGGTLMYLNFKKPIEVNEVRVALPDNLKDSIIQKVVAGDRNQINLRAKTSKQEEASQILAALKQAMPDNEPEVLRQQIVGPQVGEGLAKQAAWCIIFGSLMILLYVTLRFEFIYAAAAVIALAHDALITVSVFSLLDKEFTLTIVAAILTIIGYSANDTIVIFDRIRENCRHKEVEMKKSMKAFRQELNRSVNQTLSRTFLTTLLTLFVVLTIFVFGGEVIHDFVFALLIGMIAGTYSTVFIATPIVFWWRSRKVA